MKLLPNDTKHGIQNRELERDCNWIFHSPIKIMLENGYKSLLTYTVWTMMNEFMMCLF